MSTALTDSTQAGTVHEVLYAFYYHLTAVSTLYLNRGECVGEKVVQEGALRMVLHHHPQFKPKTWELSGEIHCNKGMITPALYCRLARTDCQVS